MDQIDLPSILTSSSDKFPIMMSVFKQSIKNLNLNNINKNKFLFKLSSYSTIRLLSTENNLKNSQILNTVYQTHLNLPIRNKKSYSTVINKNDSDNSSESGIYEPDSNGDYQMPKYVCT